MKNTRTHQGSSLWRVFLLLLILMPFSHNAFAQRQYKISGYVLDNETIKALPSATIKLPGNQYTITEGNGHFNFTVAAGDTVVFSSIGFAPYTFVLKDSSQYLSNYRIYMKPMSYQLNSVVVQGEKQKGAVLKATDYLDEVSSPITFFGKDARTQRKIHQLEAQEAATSKHIYWQYNNELIPQFSGLTGTALDDCTMYCNTHINLEPNDNKTTITHKILTIISDYQKQEKEKTTSAP